MLLGESCRSPVARAGHGGCPALARLRARARRPPGRREPSGCSRARAVRSRARRAIAARARGRRPRAHARRGLRPERRRRTTLSAQLEASQQRGVVGESQVAAEPQRVRAVHGDPPRSATTGLVRDLSPKRGRRRVHRQASASPDAAAGETGRRCRGPDHHSEGTRSASAHARSAARCATTVAASTRSSSWGASAATSCSRRCAPSASPVSACRESRSTSPAPAPRCSPATATVRDRRGHDVTDDVVAGCRDALAALDRAGVVAFIAQGGLAHVRAVQGARREAAHRAAWRRRLRRDARRARLLPHPRRRARQRAAVVGLAPPAARVAVAARARPIERRRDLYDAWHVVKFVVQETDRPFADEIGRGLAALPKGASAERARGARAEMLDALEKPSTQGADPLGDVEDVRARAQEGPARRRRPARPDADSPEVRLNVDQLARRARRAGAHLLRERPALRHQPRHPPRRRAPPPERRSDTAAAD